MYLTLPAQTYNQRAVHGEAFEDSFWNIKETLVIMLYHFQMLYNDVDT
jgi:hypothetical protein